MNEYVGKDRRKKLKNETERKGHDANNVIELAEKVSRLRKIPVSPYDLLTRAGERDVSPICQEISVKLKDATSLDVLEKQESVKAEEARKDRVMAKASEEARIKEIVRTGGVDKKKSYEYGT